MILVCTVSHGNAALDNQLSSLKIKETQKMQNSLSQKQQAIIPIAAYAANGNIAQLNQKLHDGLDQGLTINQIKSVLVQSYAYAGFPRSLNALNALMSVLNQRKSKGIRDFEGEASTALSKDYNALTQGAQNQTELVGQPVKGPLFDFSPEIDEYLKAHLFGDIFSNDVLSWQDREIATLSMLAAMTGTEGQLKSHVQMSLNIDMTAEQLQQLQQILNSQVSAEASQKLEDILQTIK